MINKEEKLYDNVASLLGRVLIGGLFTYAGFGKIMNFQGTAGYMSSVGLPFAEFLLVLVIILEFLGGIAFLLGYKTKIIAFSLAVFALLAALIFHSDFTQQGQMIYFTKNLMIMGGLLQFSVYGAGRVSLDSYCSKRKA